jgi:hypothetical protein
MIIAGLVVLGLLVSPWAPGGALAGGGIAALVGRLGRPRAQTAEAPAGGEPRPDPAPPGPS